MRRIVYISAILTLFASVAQTEVYGRAELQLDFGADWLAKDFAVFPRQPAGAFHVGLPQTMPRGERSLLLREQFGRESILADDTPCWVITRPIAVGEWCRPADWVGVSWTHNEALGTPYFRISCDLKHWSSWKALDTRITTDETTGLERGGGRIDAHEGSQQEYTRMMKGYERAVDPKNATDVSAAARWMVAQEPDFFAGNFPFVGYVELMFETKVGALRSVQAATISTGWMVGGWGLPAAFSERPRQTWNYSAFAASPKVETLK